LWWPDDRAWRIASGVDLQSSYLGAHAECVQQLIDDRPLEIVPVGADQSVTWSGWAFAGTPALLRMARPNPAVVG
jgi:hypothetical protein